MINFCVYITEFLSFQCTCTRTYVYTYVSRYSVLHVRVALRRFTRTCRATPFYTYVSRYAALDINIVYKLTLAKVAEQD